MMPTYQCGSWWLGGGSVGQRTTIVVISRNEDVFPKGSGLLVVFSFPEEASSLGKRLDPIASGSLNHKILPVAEERAG